MRDFINVSGRYFVGWLIAQWRKLYSFLVGNGEYQYSYFPCTPTQSLWPVFVFHWRGLRRLFVGVVVTVEYGMFTALIGCILFSIGIQKSVEIKPWERYHAEQ